MAAAAATIFVCLLVVGTYSMYLVLDDAIAPTPPPISNIPVSATPPGGTHVIAMTENPPESFATISPSLVPGVTIGSKAGGVATTIPNPKLGPDMWMLLYLLPVVAGFFFGFLGSIPIAGPTSAMVLKMGIQGQYWDAQTVALGGAVAEATYAGVAYWGFGSFLVGVGWLLPVSKILGACMLLVVGIVFLRLEVQPQIESDSNNASAKNSFGPSSARALMAKHLLLGFTMSGFNPALLATYTGALASVYHTGYLEFTLFLAVFFSVGVACGISTWFYILLALLKTYKQRLKNQTIGAILRCMGILLIALGLYCTKSAIDYFLL
ncbi:hypothetical protein H310_02075 [Aphanomyces invadans]|uniref:Uncharacterized protein n=1 Tax=Aphanomyces invadans TaxID=157072 RepID=A0A024UMR3_9STRA|nr:hypothetical protein H310_02075 [Aphanomyces invadans]ETW07599.1 hypothetical protein H310_02075 [Aphanomyces invadans]|eukprot:XP_008863692.1 hypothetical protein H310_02075 [Aphanomyces invadans]